MRSPTFSRVKPNWLMIDAGALSSMTARCRENAASSTVTGLPEAKCASDRRRNL